MSDAATPNVAPAAAPQATPNPGANADPSAAPQAGETPAEARERKRLVLQEYADDDEIVMVVDGKEKVVPFREYRRNTQRAESADQRYRAAVERQKAAEEKEQRAFAQAEALRQDLADPRRFYEAVRELKLDPRQLAEQVLRIEQEEAALSPAEKKLREYERQFQAMQQQQAEQEAQQKEAQIQQHMRATEQRLHAVLDQCGIPKEETVTRARLIQHLAAFTDYIRRTEQRNPSLSEGIQEVERVVQSFHNSAKARMKPEQMIDQITPEMVAEWNKRQAANKMPTVAEAKRSNPNPNQPRGNDGKFIQDSKPAVVADISDLYEAQREAARAAGAYKRA